MKLPREHASVKTDTAHWGRSLGSLINVVGGAAPSAPQRMEQALQRLCLEAGSIPSVGLQKGGLRSSVTPMLTRVRAELLAEAKTSSNRGRPGKTHWVPGPLQGASLNTLDALH